MKQRKNKIIQGRYFSLIKLSEEQIKQIVEFETQNQIFPERFIGCGLGRYEAFFREEDALRVISFLKLNNIIKSE